MHYNVKRGFTLIELLVVVLIIGILSAVALPQYNKVVKKAQGREAIVALNTLNKALSSYYLEHGTYEGVDNSTLPVEMPELKYALYGRQVGTDAPVAASNIFDENAIYYQVGTSGTNEINSAILLPEVSILGNWKKGRLESIKCSKRDVNNSISCADYIDCNAQPVVHQQAGTDYYSGGNCTLSY